ncbi:cation:proton antiporter [Maricaulaceae bacterium EIL42A08]|nr:cation:proton antiporter [Maricaulaceae bacterium EIL42A08]
MPEVIAILPAVKLLGIGLLCILAAKALKTSNIVAFIAAGLVIGPFGFSLVEQSQTTALLAQLGVVFLLFEIGLGFSSKTLKESGRDLVVLGPLQMATCGAGFALIAKAFGLDWPLAILVGLGAGISATAVVSATMADRGIVTCPLGKSSTALLVFQDIAGIFLLVFAVSLETGEGSLALALGEAGLKAVLAAGAALLIGRYAARPALTLLARTNSPEIFTATALFLVLATAAATGALELSLTLGAFLAGVIVAETPYKTVVKTEAKPFGALLLGFFFITVGMALDWRVLVAEAPLILAALAALMIGKTVLTFIAALLSGWSRPGATQLSFLTAQGSEFGLVLLALPAVSGALGAQAAAVLVGATAASLALTPAWTALGMKLARKLAQAKVKVSEPTASPDGGRPILVFAMTASSRLALDGLRKFHIPYVAIDSDADRFMDAVSDGYDVTFGDPSDVRLMKAVGVTNARALALGEARYEISKDVTPFVQENYPDMARFVVVTDDADRDRHEALNMHAVINRAMPEGLDFAIALLRFAEIEEHKIAGWMREVMDAYEPERLPGMPTAA